MNRDLKYLLVVYYLKIDCCAHISLSGGTHLPDTGEKCISLYAICTSENVQDCKKAFIGGNGGKCFSPCGYLNVTLTSIWRVSEYCIMHMKSDKPCFKKEQSNQVNNNKDG